MFLPLKDHNPTARTPVVTMALIAINLVVWMLELAQGDQLPLFIARWGAIPFELTHFVELEGSLSGGPVTITPGSAFLPITTLTSMFLHGGWAHILFNMLYLWIFGNNVEDWLGRGRFIVFYLGTGLAGLLGHIAFHPNSMVPTIGASGAIAGVLGGYLLLYPRARVTSLIFLGIFFTFVELPAGLLIGIWAVLQLLGGVGRLGVSGVAGVAYWAHLSGIVIGYLVMRWLARGSVHQRREAQRWRDAMASAEIPLDQDDDGLGGWPPRPPRRGHYGPDDPPSA